MRELNKLEVFEGCFYNVRDLSMYAGQTKRLHNYLIWLSTRIIIHPSDAFVAQNIYYSKMVAFEGFDINSGDGIILPYDIQKLRVVNCGGMRSLNDISGLKDATDLKECRIFVCNELESVFSSKFGQLETLEHLQLRCLLNLKAIIVGESSVGTFSSLNKIYLERCGKIKNLFSAKWVLHNLEEISVFYCDEMEEIIVSEEEGMGNNTNTIKYTLPKLSTLELWKLPKLKSICSKNGVMVCDSLQYINIENCLKLKRIPLHLPLLDLDKEKPSPPPALKEIRVYPKKWWESVEWDHPDAKNVLLPLLKLW